jgi:translation initiation factor 5
MAMVNVNRQTNDMFYRYKMPKLAAKVEGTGNGIKTVLVNASAIAKALDRPPTCKHKQNSLLINSYFLYY